MTPYAFGQSLLSQLQSLALSEGVTLPTPAYTVLAEPVIDCASTIVALTGMEQSGDPSLDFCGSPQYGTYNIIIARECAVVFDDNGYTDVTAAGTVSTQLSTDGELLWSFANQLDDYLIKTWSVGFVIEGGLSVASLLLTTGIR